MSNVKVIGKFAKDADGRELFLQIIEIDDKRGWVTKQMCEYFGVTKQSITNAMNKTSSRGYSLNVPQILVLRDAGIVRPNTTAMKFYNSEEIARIASHLDSQRARDMLVYGFGVGVAAARGDTAKVAELTGNPSTVGLNPTKVFADFKAMYDGYQRLSNDFEASQKLHAVKDSIIVKKDETIATVTQLHKVEVVAHQETRNVSSLGDGQIVEVDRAALGVD